MNEYIGHGQHGEQSQDGSHLQQEWFRVALSSIGDAVIATDADGRVTFLNPVAQSLTGWTEDEAEGAPLEEVFQIVNEETRQPAENPVTNALRENTVVGLANHTLLIRKNGEELAIADSAAPIRNAAGETVGVVLVFRDVTEKRRAEIAVRDAKQYAENIVDTVRHPLLILDGELRVQTTNRSFYRTFHVSPEETENRLVYDLGNGQWNIPELRRLLTEILPQNTSFDGFEVEHDFPSIGRRYMLLNARRMYREEEHTELILLAIEDVTDQRRATEERREIETRFTSLVKNIKDHSIFTLDPSGHITSWNVEAEKILGYSEREALGQHFSLIFTPEDVEQGVPQQELDAAREVGRAEDERWHRRKDGELFWALGIVTPTIDAEGTHTGYSKILRDMTDRKRAEEELHRLAAESERQRRVYETVLSNTEDFNYVFDLEGRFIYINRALLALWRKELSEAVGKNFFDLGYPPQLAARLQQQIQQVIDTEQSLKGETSYKSADGERQYEYIFVPVLGSHGEVEAVAGSSRDITERKALEDNLRQLAADLSETDHRKTEFLATLGHELRNPLAPIRTGLELMKLVSDDPVQMEEVRRMMEVQAQQMVRLIDDLLDVSRISQGKLTLRRRRVALAEVVQNAVEASRPFIDEAGHQLTVTLPPQSVSIEADPNRLAQVVSNLLNNSAKYTPQRGHIWLTAEHEEGDVIIRVSDDGIGIPAEVQNDIFEMFNQINRDLEHGHKGLGIGLTLVKRLVEMHGGRVEVRSNGVGQGSEFSVRLPISVESSTSEREATEHDVAVTTSGLRILVVDDNKAAADMLSMVVKTLGNDVRTANDGQQAIEVAAEFLPDVVLMDIGMPKMNGYEAARHIRQQPWSEKMVLVALTGWGQDEDKQRTKEAGFDHHLVKPAEPADLQRLLAMAGGTSP